MKFICTVRDTNGVVRTEFIEAASRAEVFTFLQYQKLIPVSIRENKRCTSVCPCGIGHRTIIVCTIMFIVSITLSICVFYRFSEHDSEELNQTTVRTLDKLSYLSTSVSEGALSVATTTTKKAMGVATTNDLVTIPTFNAPPSPAKSSSPTMSSFPPPVFETASDQVIAMALQANEHGMAPMPLSPDLEREFIASLTKEITIFDTDDAQIRALKESVRTARAEIKKLLDEGQSFTQIIQEHQRLANENARIRDNATLELKWILDSGDIEGAKAYKHKINAALGQMGIKELSIPVTEKERAERAAIRRERMLERRARQTVVADNSESMNKE